MGSIRLKASVWFEKKPRSLPFTSMDHAGLCVVGNLHVVSARDFCFRCRLRGYLQAKYFGIPGLALASKVCPMVQLIFVRFQQLRGPGTPNPAAAAHPKPTA